MDKWYYSLPGQPNKCCSELVAVVVVGWTAASWFGIVGHTTFQLLLGKRWKAVAAALVHEFAKQEAVLVAEAGSVVVVVEISFLLVALKAAEIHHRIRCYRHRIAVASLQIAVQSSCQFRLPYLQYCSAAEEE